MCTPPAEQSASAPTRLSGLSAGFVLRARAARDYTRRRGMRTHRHGRVGLVDDLGLDSFHLSLVQPLGVRVGGRHLVQWYHLRGLMACRDKLRRERRVAHRISTRIRIGCNSVERIAATGCLPICLPRTHLLLSEGNEVGRVRGGAAAVTGVCPKTIA